MVDFSSSDERFWSKVDKTDECWNWTKPLNQYGYGQFWHDGKLYLAHRWSYLRHVGDIPEGLSLDHLCRNKSCVNPAHLEPVTLKENNARMHKAIGLVETCKNGHPREGNTYTTKRGHRDCAICAREKTARQYRKRKAERNARISRGI